VARVALYSITVSLTDDGKLVKTMRRKSRILLETGVADGELTFAPEWLSRPVITAFQQDVPATFTAGSYIGTPAPTITYVWKVDGVTVSETSAYTPILENVGKSMTLTATATNGYGSATVTSDAVIVDAAEIDPQGDAVPTLRASQTSGVAPLGIVFDGVQTTHPTAESAVHDLLYFFDFGDGSAGTYTYGTLAGETLNRAVGGPGATHVYTAPGSYTARMWVWDGVGLSGPVSQAITVTDPDVVYSGTNTVVVSTSGTFTGKPIGATEVTSSDFDATMITYATAGKRVLFRGGETFLVSTNTDYMTGGRTDVYVGNFGTGKAIIQATADGRRMIGGPVANPVERIRVTGVRFDAGGFSGVFGIVLNAAGRPAAPTSGNGGGVLDPNTLTGYSTIHDCEFSGVDGNIYAHGRGMVLSKILIENTNNGVASSGIGMYAGDYYQMGIIDCRVDANYGGEHAIRLDGGQIVAVESCHISRVPTSRNYLTFRSGQNYEARYMVARGNFFDGSYASALAGTMVHVGNANASFPWTRPRDVVFERNYLHAHDLAANAYNIAEAQDISVRSNAIYYPASFNQGGNNMDIISVSYASTSTPKTEAAQLIRVYNNSLYNASIKSPRMASVYNATAEAAGVTPTGDVRVCGNVAYTPGSGGATVYMESLTSGTVSPWGTLSNNSTQTQMRSANPQFLNVPPTSLESFVVTTGSYAINGGADVKTFIDAQGKLRNSGGYDMGAVNSAPKDADAWSLLA
jgi:PKD domain